MARIEWSNELSVGVKQIDDQHKELIRITNVLINAVHAKQQVNILDDTLSRLRDYTVTHFTDEEKLMTEVSYPERGEHVIEHTRLKRSVKDYRRQLYKKEDLTPDDVLEFMKDWLLTHILTYDRDLANFIHEQEAETSPGEAEADVDEVDEIDEIEKSRDP